MTDDEMVGWHHWLNGHEFEQTLGDSEDREAWCAAMGSQRFGHDLATEQQQREEHLEYRHQMVHRRARRQLGWLLARVVTSQPRTICVGPSSRVMSTE